MGGYVEQSNVMSVMKNLKVLMLIAAVVAFASCESDNVEVSAPADTDTLVVTGYSNGETRTAFGVPGASEIPYTWTKGDYIWLGNNKSSAIAEECTLTAKWTVNKYTVTLNANGGSVTPSAVLTAKGNKITLPTPTNGHMNYLTKWESLQIF